jgi:hypothetical protein
MAGVVTGGVLPAEGNCGAAGVVGVETTASAGASFFHQAKLGIPLLPLVEQPVATINPNTAIHNPFDARMAIGPYFCFTLHRRFDQRHGLCQTRIRCLPCRAILSRHAATGTSALNRNIPYSHLRQKSRPSFCGSCKLHKMNNR